MSAPEHYNVHKKLAFFSELATRASLFNGVAGGLQISKKCIDRVPLARANSWVGKGYGRSHRAASAAAGPTMAGRYGGALGAYFVISVRAWPGVID